MKTKVLYIIDIRFKHNKLSLNNYLKNKNIEILSLTPYSNLLVENLNMSFITFHDIVSVSKFHDIIMKEYERYESIFKDYKELGFLFRYMSFIITYEKYIEYIRDYLEKRKKENVRISYITDSSCMTLEKKVNYLKSSYLFKLDIIDDIIIINQKDNSFYKVNKTIYNYNILKNKKNVIKRFIKKHIFKRDELSYDNANYLSIFQKIKPVRVEKKLNIDKFNKLELTFRSLHKNNIFFKKYCNIFSGIKNKLLLNEMEHLKIRPFTYLADEKAFIEGLQYKENNIPRIFMQHGSYLYDHIFLKYNEVFPSSLNFLINEYTNKEFMGLGSNNTSVVGSVNFNYSLKEEKKEFDFLYITHCTTYSHNATYIDGKQSLYSMDANNIYNRHINIINIFGRKFKDKRICIKIQPGIMLGTMLYIPFLELSKKYKNIVIEFSVPLSKLIQKSKYIISDYFSSEFINRELHYKRDIILFNAAPLVLPEETVEDMKKMFILVDNVDDLEKKISNIEIITKDRPIYDDIIEYYSSKKCETKKVVTEILEKELNARI